MRQVRLTPGHFVIDQLILLRWNNVVIGVKPTPARRADETVNDQFDRRTWRRFVDDDVMVRSIAPQALSRTTGCHFRDGWVSYA
jgi:hypothetical protein